MEQTDNIEALMERIKEQETMYEFDRIDEELALQMGFYVVRRAREMGKPVATRITLNRRTLFSLSMAGTKPESDNWLRRKENLAYATNQSSYFWECWCEQGLHPFEWRGMSYENYAPAGGCFPLCIKGAGMVGTLAISGMASHEDHALAFEAVEKAVRGELGIDVSGLMWGGQPTEFARPAEDDSSAGLFFRTALPVSLGGLFELFPAGKNTAARMIYLAAV